jgi:hypothetical protein
MSKQKGHNVGHTITDGRHIITGGQTLTDGGQGIVNRWTVTDSLCRGPDLVLPFAASDAEIAGLLAMQRRPKAERDAIARVLTSWGTE